MKKLVLLITLFIINNSNKTFAQNTSWNLNPYVDYTNYIDLQAEVKGYRMGDDDILFTVRNLSNSQIFFSVEFIIVDICGKSHSHYWGGSVSLKSGASDNEQILLATGCAKDKNLKTTIASITCRVFDFKNLTEEENKRKEERVKREKELQFEKDKKEKERLKKEQIAKEEEAQNAKKEAEQKIEKELAEKENAAKQIKDETERKAALEKVENEKIAAEKKSEEKKATEKKPLNEEEQKAMWERNGRASKLEADGDELVYKDASAAKRLYEQAQLINYTNRVAEKIKNLKTNLQVQAGFQAIQGVDKLADELDPKGKTRFYEMFSGYDGFASNNDKLNKLYQSNPWQLHAFGFRMSAIFLAAELRMGYYNSPYYQFEVRNNKDVNRNIDNVGIQHQSISIGLSGGLNIPIKNFCIYSLYGVEWLGGVTAKNIQEGKGYRFDDDDYSPKFPDIMFVLSSGIDFRIPKTRLGIGVRYNVNNVQIKPRDANIKLKGGADTRYQYFMNRISPEKVVYSNLGLRLIWKWNN